MHRCEPRDGLTPRLRPLDGARGIYANATRIEPVTADGAAIGRWGSEGRAAARRRESEMIEHGNLLRKGDTRRAPSIAAWRILRSEPEEQSMSLRARLVGCERRQAFALDEVAIHASIRRSSKRPPRSASRPFSGDEVVRHGGRVAQSSTCPCASATREAPWAHGSPVPLRPTASRACEWPRLGAPLHVRCRAVP